MKTLADFKRALTIGSKWKAIYHSHNLYNGVDYQNELGIGEVIKKQTNGVKFKRDDKESWLYFPSANYFETDGKKAYIYIDTEPKQLRLTYELIQGE